MFFMSHFLLFHFVLQERYIVLLSRVTEKGAAFQVAIKTWVLQRLSDQGFLKPRDTVRSWSDCGPNLRCKEVLGYHATELITKFKCHQYLNFRLGCHGKSKSMARAVVLGAAKHLWQPSATSRHCLNCKPPLSRTLTGGGSSMEAL